LPRISIGAAIAIVEYAPIKTPISITKLKLLMPGPPQRYIIRTARKTVKDVRIPLDNV
jgi:hypothetical protein